jgi:hypothetical protein
MRLITIGLTTILATLALASSTVAATNANTLTGTVGPTDTLYFLAGPSGEQHGLFGSITAE